MGLWRAILLGAVAVSALNTSEYNSYFTYDQVAAKIVSLASQAHVLITQVQTGTLSTKTANGKSIPYLKITDTSSTIAEQYKAKILVTAQHQVLGMTGASMVLYIAESLLESSNLSYLQSKVFYLVPVVNVDSYSLAEANSPFSTQYVKNQNGGTCASGKKGVNLDRNYASSFAVQTDQCGDEYGGAQAFSEAETTGIKDLIGGIGSLDLVVDYDKSGAMYILPKASGTSPSYDLSADYSAFITQFSTSGDFAQSGGSLTTYYSADSASAGGAFIDYISASTSALPIQIRLGPLNQSPTTALSTLLQNNLPAFFYLTMHTRTNLMLAVSTVQEPKCGTTVSCAHSWAISTIQLPFVLKNDAIGSTSPIVFQLDLSFPSNSTYTYLLTNLTRSSYDYTSTAYDFTSGISIAYTNTTVNLPTLQLRASMPSDRTRVLYTLMVNIERFKNPEVASYKDEVLAFSYRASVNGIDTAITGMKSQSSGTYGLQASYVNTPSTPDNSTPTDNGSNAQTAVFAVGYKEPVVLGLGLLLLLLFTIIAVGICGLIWLLNKPGAEAGEMTGAKAGKPGESEVPFSPQPRV